ncbi:putative vacuolar protein sorting-associated protein 16, partial [Neolecta irregularis DAH-3]
IRDFSQIDAWSKSRNPPIGYEPFFYECLGAGNTRLAATFIPKCNPSNRVEFFLKVGDWGNAGKLAFAAKDITLLEDIKSKAGSAAPSSELDAMLAQLTTKLSGR